MRALYLCTSHLRAQCFEQCLGVKFAEQSPLVQEAERKARRKQAREQEQAELKRAHSQWSKKQQEGLREQLPVQPPRPVALKRENTSILVNLRRDVTGDAAIVRLASMLPACHGMLCQC